MDILKKQFTKGLQVAQTIANNSYLIFLRNAVEQVEKASVDDTLLSEYVEKLLKITKVENFSLDASKTNEFAQLLGEAHFYLLCKNKGVTLAQVPVGNTKTPDFRVKEKDIYFEIKTLSVAGGDHGIQKELNASLTSQINIENQLREGKNIATSETVVQPYGNKPYQKTKGPITTVIETLLEKTKQNFKNGQYSSGDTFLVLNLSILPPFRTDSCVLRPVYCENSQLQQSVTGELWMLAFGRPNMIILCNPEFAGKPCVESLMKQTGILFDKEYEKIAGILFMIHPWQRETEIWSLCKFQSFAQWEEKNISIINILSKIVGDNWNDDMDSNGWHLHRK